MFCECPNPFHESKDAVITNRFARFWFSRLWQIATSAFLIENAPESVNVNYIESVLLTNGYIGFQKINDELYSLPVTIETRDPYMYPDKCFTANWLLGENKFKNNYDGVVMLSNKHGTPAINIITEYAEQLARIEVNIKVNLDNTKIDKIFIAETPEQANKIRKLVDDVVSGKLAVIAEPDIADKIFNEEGKLPVYSSPSEYMVDKLIENRRQIFNDFLNTFGIDTSGANVVKAERNTNLEVESNDMQITVQRDFWLEPRRRALKKINELFGTDMTYTVVGLQDIVNEDQTETEEESNAD